MLDVNIYPTEKTYDGDYMKFCIRPAEANLPEWYKKSSSYFGDTKDKRFFDKRMTVKKCIPVFDYLSTGLNLYLPFSFYSYGSYPERIIDADTHGTYCKLGMHDMNQVQKFPIDDSYDPLPRKIDFPYMIETPKGYSSLYIQPQNEYSETLLFPSGLVNTDNYKNQVNFPFFIKKDFTGEVPAGTHFMSVFFIKRDKINLKYKEYENGIDKISQARAMVQNWGRHFYKNTRFN